MDDLLSEKEQLEQMRTWWSENGRYVIAGVVIAVGLLFGFNQYNSARLAAQVEASKLYEALAEHVTDGNAEEAEVVAGQLASDYANTPYAAQSKLAMARLYMDRNRDVDAAEALRQLLALRGNAELKHIGRLRLARILLYQDKPEDVVELLESLESPAFAALSNEILGDAYAALGQTADAATAYRAALADQAQAPTIDRGLVQMKLNDLPSATAAAAPPEPAAVAAPAVEPAMEQETETGPVSENDAAGMPATGAEPEPAAEPLPEAAE